MSPARRLLARYGDVVAAACFAALMVIDLVQQPGGRRLSVLLCALVATLALAGRRRFPLSAFLLVWVGMFGLARIYPAFVDETFGYAVVLLFALFSVGAYVGKAQVWASVAAVGICPTVLVQMTTDEIAVFDVILLLFFVGTPWGFGTFLRLFRERRAVDAERTSRLLTEEAERSAQALEAERALIARELHDVVSHAMAVTLMQARGGRRVQASDPDAAHAAFDAIEHANTQALGDMRRMLNVLREADTPDQALAPMPSLHRLPQLIDQLRAGGIDVHLTVEGDLDQVPPGVELSAYRVIQEALTNVLKHAAPATATVTVRCSSDQLDIDITDNGTRTTPTTPTGGGHGLNGMKERVQVLGGTIHTGPAEPTGFTVQAQLPYQVTP